RYVRRRRINHGIVIREGDLREHPAIVIVIECAPAAIAILHRKQPLHPATSRCSKPPPGRVIDTLQSHEYKGGVVDVGIEMVAEFKHTSAWLSLDFRHLSVTRSW